MDSATTSTSNAATRTKRHDLLGSLLLKNGKLTEADLEKALALKKTRGLKIGQALVELGLITELDLAAALRKQGRLTCLHLIPEIVDNAVAVELGEEKSRRLKAVAINKIAKMTTVAMADPNDLAAVDEIAISLNAKIFAVYAEPRRIERVIDAVFHSDGKHKDSLENIAGTLEVHEEGLARIEATGDESATDVTIDAPVVNMVRSMLTEACRARASDVHLEPQRDRFVVRYRIDGLLHERLRLEKRWARPCLARLKVVAQLDLAQSRLPQDGRALAEVDGHLVDLRIATTPTTFGEAAVVRILNSGRDVQKLANLGLSEPQSALLQAMVQGCEGMILATGPTGSGKTTTLYAMLAELNDPTRKIITLEDPVENQMEGITQISVNAKAGLTFARGFRSILRQDPDVVLVGEIRDEETARIAVTAALTGHLVLSTVHTIGAPETITRLMTMGIEGYLISDALRGVIAQRLVRKICTNCKRPAQVDPKVLERVGFEGDTKDIAEGAGCDECFQSGFKGRTPVYEILLMTGDLCDLVRQGANSDQIRTAALKTGLVRLRQDALRKVGLGLTTIAEALEVSGRA